MSNYSIFAVQIIIEDSLYAIKYKDKEYNEFSRLFEDWSDIEFLESFFEEHKQDLQSGFYKNISIEDAVEQTLIEADGLEQLIKKIAVKGKSDDYQNLQTLFKPLNNRDEYPIPDYQKTKVYGSARNSWLRMYAIRIESNTFVITGGAIKLTRTMNERTHLLEELEKLKSVKQALIEEGIIDSDSLIEFFEIKRNYE
ncbi:MAG: hypothetical protein J7J72_01020 [Bacteroidales bacterium]|nr:hypothetical protein [Bacteroidales bacterium]